MLCQLSTCHNTFAPKPTHRYQKWCSQKCASKANYMKRVSTRERRLYFRRNHFRYTRTSKYGITAHEFDDLLIKQAGRCAICIKPLLDDLCTDHDHNTGRVRGLLCRLCNRAIERLENSPTWAEHALAYLKSKEN